MAKKAGITWSSQRVEVSKIKPTPNNYKIKTELGMERLRHSLSKFGLAGNVVLNADCTLIDGNSRWESAKKNGEKFLWASMPSRKLTAEEFTEMSAMFDFAKAGEVDFDRIKKELGTKEDFYKQWGLEMPLDLLEKLGKGGKGVTVSAGKTGAAELEERVATSDIRMVQLFLSSKDEAAFRKMEEVLMKRFKTDNVTDTVFKAFKFLTNGK
jgi:hypothetical protein